MSQDKFYLRKVTQRPYLISSLDKNIFVKVFYTKVKAFYTNGLKYKINTGG